MLGEKLQRDLPVELRVISLIDDTHAALAELLNDLVVADRGADVQDRGSVALWVSRKGRQRGLRVPSDYRNLQESTPGRDDSGPQSRPFYRFALTLRTLVGAGKSPFNSCLRAISEGTPCRSSQA